MYLVHRKSPLLIRHLPVLSLRQLQYLLHSKVQLWYLICKRAYQCQLYLAPVRSSSRQLVPPRSLHFQFQAPQYRQHYLIPRVLCHLRLHSRRQYWISQLAYLVSQQWVPGPGRNRCILAKPTKYRLQGRAKESQSQLQPNVKEPNKIYVSTIYTKKSNQNGMSKSFQSSK